MIPEAIMLPNKELNSFNVPQLTEICRRLSLPTSGKKAILISRIENDLNGKGVPIESLLNFQPSRPSKLGSSRMVEGPFGSVALKGESSSPNSLKKPQCLCGTIQNGQLQSESRDLISCTICLHKYHTFCYNWRSPSDFVCIWCRILLLDPFYELGNIFYCIELRAEWYNVDLDLRKYSNASNEEVIVSCHRVDTAGIFHEWPNTLSISINNKRELNILAPSWEHKRKEEPFKIPSVLKTFLMKTIIKQSNFDTNPGTFILSIGSYKPLSIPYLAKIIQENNFIPFDTAQLRILKIVSQTQEDDDVQCMEISRRIKLDCPYTFSRMKIPCRGRECKHLQCYDLVGFLEVTQKLGSFNRRWKCSECNLIVRPKDLVVDGYVKYLLNSTEPATSAVEIQQNGDFTVVDELDSLNERIKADKKRNLLSSLTSYGQPTASFTPPPSDPPIEIFDLENDDDNPHSPSSFNLGNIDKEVNSFSQQHNEQPLPENESYDPSYKNYTENPPPPKRKCSPASIETETRPLHSDFHDIILLSDSETSDNESCQL